MTPPLAVAGAGSAPVVLGDALLRGVFRDTRVRDALLIVSGALLTALLAQIAIDVPPSPVPVTGQTLAVVIVGASLGARRGATSLLLYVLMGLALPVYAGGNSGAHVVWGATGGYLIGFVVAAWVIGRFSELGASRDPLLAFGAFCLGQLCVFGIGVPWLAISADLPLGTAIHYGFSIFIVGGIVKALVGAAVVPGAWRLVGRVDGHR